MDSMLTGLSDALNKIRKSGIASPDENSPEDNWLVQGSSKTIISPIDEYPSNMNLFDGNNSLFDDTLDLNTQVINEDLNNSSDSSHIQPIDDWSKIKINNWEASKQVNITFGQLWKETQEVIFITNDNYITRYEFNPSMINTPSNRSDINDTYNWDNRNDNTEYQYNNNMKYLYRNSKLQEIIIKDLNNIKHSVYKKD